MAREVHHNTPQQVGQYLAQALKIIEKADVPEDLRPVALSVVYGSLASKQIFMDQTDMSGGVLLAAPGVGRENLR